MFKDFYNYLLQFDTPHAINTMLILIGILLLVGIPKLISLIIELKHYYKYKRTTKFTNYDF